MPEIRFNLMIITDGADGKLHAVSQEAKEVKQEIEKPAEVKISAEKALATVRDVKIAFDGVTQVLSGLVMQINQYLDASLAQRQAVTLSKLAFGAAADEMGRFASSMQQVTNFEDDQLLALMSKLAQTFKLNKDEIQELTPMLLDFTEANKATGMTVESAFDLMGRALNGHTEMLGRYGIELDATRLKTEGVAYLVEKLGEDYGGTAIALADLRLQNANAWGDIKETIGDMLTELLTPLLQSLNWLMTAYKNLNPVAKGFVTGLVIAVPLIAATATAVTALSAAFHALRTAINPVAGMIGIVVGVLSILGFGIAAASMQMKGAADSTDNMKQKIKEVNQAVEVEAEKFQMLASRLIQLRGQSNLTAKDKSEMASIIRSLNENYGDYLGNINLETSSQRELAKALNASLNAMIQQQAAKGMGDLFSQQVGKIAELQLKLKALGGSLRESLTLPKDMAEGAKNFFGIDVGSVMGSINKSDPFQAQRIRLEEQLEKETSYLNDVRIAYTEAMALVSVPIEGVVGGGEAGSQTLVNEAKDLIAELAKARQSETQQLEAEYQKRKAIVLAYTADGSEAEKTALLDLDAWKTQKETEIAARETAGVQNKFRSEVSYLANLQEMGVSSYDQLKAKMEEYYNWAVANLPAEEAALVLKQLQESNLRWGAHQKEKEDKERAHQERLFDIRREWDQRDMSRADLDLQAELEALRRKFEAEKAVMLEAGLTEEQITEMYARKKAKIITDSNDKIADSNEQTVLNAAGGLSRMMSNMGSAFNKESKKGFAAWKAMAIAQGYIDTFASAIGAYRSMSILGPVVAAAAAAAAMVAGLANIANISKQEYKPPQAAEGGLLYGPGHNRGGVLIEAEGGEFVINKKSTSKYRDIIEMINSDTDLNDLDKGLMHKIGKNANMATNFIGSFFGLLRMRNLQRIGSKMEMGGYIPALDENRFNNIFSFPMPDFAYASGGSINGSNPVTSLLASLDDKLGRLLEKKVAFDIHVDPLSNNPVRVSEIAEQGSIIRSGY